LNFAITDLLHGKAAVTFFSCLIDRNFEADGIGKLRNLRQLALDDMCEPKRATSSIADCEAGFAGKCFPSPENGGHCDRFATGNQGGSLGSRDADTRTAVAPRSAADQNHVEGSSSELFEDFPEGFKQERVVTAVAGERFLRNDFPLLRKCDGCGICGGLDDEDGVHWFDLEKIFCEAGLILPVQPDFSTANGCEYSRMPGIIEVNHNLLNRGSFLLSLARRS
jgi:hypothetical protein